VIELDADLPAELVPLSWLLGVWEGTGVVHYGVANMPGAVPRTSTFALNHATFPYLKLLATKGLADAVRSSAPLAKGVAV
jgi:alanine dehydrogenase